MWLELKPDDNSTDGTRISLAAGTHLQMSELCTQVTHARLPVQQDIGLHSLKAVPVPGVSLYPPICHDKMLQL